MRMFAAMLLGLACACAASLHGEAHAAETLPRDATQIDDLLQGEQSRLYLDTMQRYDAALQAAPDDVTLAVARCRFAAAFTDEEMGRWHEAAADDAQTCNTDVSRQFPDSPAAQLYLLDQMWGAEAGARGELLLKDADAWPQPLRRDLHARLARHYTTINPARAGELALVAAQLGDTSSVASAATYLANQGDQPAATELLRTAPPVDSAWALTQRLEAALLLDDNRVAQALITAADPALIDPYNGHARARVLLRDGDTAGALAALENAWGMDEPLRSVRFDAALTTGQYDIAAAQVQLEDTDAFPDNMQRLVRLLHTAPQMLFQPDMLLAFALLLLVLMVVMLAPGLLLLPVHYRGLIRRVRGQASTPVFAWAGLRGAWIGLGTALVTPMLAAALFVPHGLAIALGAEDPAQSAMFPIMLASTLLGLVLLSPYLWSALRDVRGTVSIPRQLGMALLALLPVYGVAMAQGLWNVWRNVDMNTAQAQAVNALINGGSTIGGPLLAFALLALLVPVLEELVFRGLLLGGMARHLRFGWANLLQALLFAAVHGDPPRFAFYFTLGLVAGYMAKRSQSLLPAIALHVMVNAIAFLILSR